jgi:hypothetical protein
MSNQYFTTLHVTLSSFLYFILEHFFFHKFSTPRSPRKFFWFPSAIFLSFLYEIVWGTRAGRTRDTAARVAGLLPST